MKMSDAGNLLSAEHIQSACAGLKSGHQVRSARLANAREAAAQTTFKKNRNSVSYLPCHRVQASDEDKIVLETSAKSCHFPNTDGARLRFFRDLPLENDMQRVVNALAG